MVIDKETNKVYFSSLIKTVKYESFWLNLKKILTKHNIQSEFIEGTRDLWCRDYMPVQIDIKEYAQFKYFPDYYLTHIYIKRLTIQDELRYDLRPADKTIKNVNLIIDGGNIVKTKNKAIMTNKVFKENDNREKESIIKMLKNALRIEELYFVPVQSFDLTGHSDGMVRFIDENTLMVNDYSKESPSWQKKMDNALKLTGLETIPFPYVPSTKKVDGEYTAKGCYINYAQIGNLILFPQFNINEDGTALKKIKQLFPEPDYYVETIDANLVAEEGGVLNCLTWNIYKPIIEDAIDYIVPVYGNENTMLVIHKDDKRPFIDTLCIDLSPVHRGIGRAWSIQKTIKSVEPINGINVGEIDKSKALLKKHFSPEQLSDILELLLHPTKTVIDELIQIPPRLRNFKPKT